MDTGRWSLTGEVLELFRKAVLRAYEWRDELALSGNSSIKSTTGHENSASERGISGSCCGLLLRILTSVVT